MGNEQQDKYLTRNLVKERRLKLRSMNILLDLLDSGMHFSHQAKTVAIEGGGEVDEAGEPKKVTKTMNRQ